MKDSVHICYSFLNTYHHVYMFEHAQTCFRQFFFLQKVFLLALLIDGLTTYLLKPAFYTKCQFLLLENPHIHMISLDP